MRELFITPTFRIRSKRFLSMHPELRTEIKRVMGLLVKDMFDPKLKTHKLHGKINKFYSCTLTYRYRLLFYFDEKLIYLHSIGSHDDIY